MRFSRCVFVVLSALALLAVAIPPVAASGDWEQVVDLTFPAEQGVTYTDTYDAPRGNDCGIHRATDLVGSKMTEIYAAVGGEIVWIPGAAEGESEPSYGYMISIRGDDGREYNYVHLNNDTPGTDDGQGGPEHAYAPGLREGSLVERGELIGWLGDSGNAESSMPHLHFEIQDPGVASDPYGCSGYINPYHSLLDAELRGDYAPGGDGSGRREGDDGTSRSAPVVPIDRIAGSDRIGTAIALSQDAFPEGSPHVVIVSAFSFPDSVTSGPLGAALDAPVLTTGGQNLDERVISEIGRLGATSATLIGGTAVLAEKVAADVAAHTRVPAAQIQRLSGASAPATAAAVAEAVWRRTGSGDALVALGAHEDPNSAWPDALTAAYHGAVSGAPVLLVWPDHVPGATQAALGRVAEATIVGGTAAVSADLATVVAAHAAETRRLSGPDRFATALAVGDDLLDAGLVSTDRLWVATGHDFADALASAGAVARNGDVFALIDGNATGGDGAFSGWLAERVGQIKAARIVGGPGAVSDEARVQLSAQL